MSRESAGSLIFYFYSGHGGILQGLSRHGIYVIDTNESAVTQQALHQTTPFKLVSLGVIIEHYCKIES